MALTQQTHLSEHIADALVYISYQIEQRPTFLQQVFSETSKEDLHTLFVSLNTVEERIRELYRTQTDFEEVIPQSHPTRQSTQSTQSTQATQATSPPHTSKKTPKTPKTTPKTPKTTATLTATATPTTINLLMPETLNDAIKIALAQQNSDGVVLKSSACSEMCVDPTEIEHMTEARDVAKYTSQLHHVITSATATSLVSHFQLGCCLHRLKQMCPHTATYEEFLQSLGVTMAKSPVNKHVRFYLFVSKYPILLATSMSYSAISKNISNIILWLPDYPELLGNMRKPCPAISIENPSHILVNALKPRMLGLIPNADDVIDVDDIFDINPLGSVANTDAPDDLFENESNDIDDLVNIFSTDLAFANSP